MTIFLSGTGSSYVNALAVSGTTVYAGGYFTTAGGVGHSANYIAMWKDNAWSALGAGMSSPVKALAVSESDLYAGGYFTTAGGKDANRIAMWDGSAWSALGAGMDDVVYALAVSGTTLYAGGNFPTAGGKDAKYIAKANLSLTTPTTTVVESTSNPSTYGASVTFTATVSASAATGTVTFKDGVTTLGTGDLSSGTATYSTTATGLSVGDHTITAEYAGDSAYAASTSDSLTQTVNKATPSVTTWPTASAITYGQTLASSGLSGGAASVAGSFAFTDPGTTPPGVGPYTADVLFTPTDTANYNPTSSTVNVTVNKATPLVTTKPTATAIIVGQSLSASSLSGGSGSVPGGFEFKTPSDKPAVGTYTAEVTFTPSDGEKYMSASVNVDVPVNKVTSLVTHWPVPTAITYGQTLALSTQNGGETSVEGKFTFDAPDTAPTAGTFEAAVTFTPTDSVNNTAVSGRVNVTVNKATPSVTTWPTASAITYRQILSVSQLSGGTPGAVSGSFAFTSPGDSPGAGDYTASVTFTPNDTDNYHTTSSTVTVTVGKATATVDLSGLSQTYDTTPRVVVATTTPSGLAVNISYHGSKSAPTAVGSYPIVATVNEANYQGSASGTLVVGPASQIITFGVIPDQLATARYELSASASIELAVSFSVTAGPGMITGGHHLTFSGVGTVTITATQAGNGSYSAASLSRSFAVGYELATVTLANMRQMYTGGPLVPTTTTAPADLAVSLTYNGGASAPVEVGSYAVAATISDAHYIGSAAGTLVIWGAPEITAQPKSVNALVKGSATFWVGVAGASPLTYQWRWNGTNIAGANGESLSFTNLVAAQSGDYEVVVVNRFGTATSVPAALRVSSYVLWGRNDQGESTPDSHPMPWALALGWYHTLNLLSDGTVTAWGGNTMSQCDVPAGLSNVVALSGGAYHSLALQADGTVVAWGQGWYGQLAIPEGLRDVVAVSAGEYHNLALKRDGTVVAWGYNIEHQCAVPTGLDSVVAVAAGGRHSLALRANGTVVAWGDNTLGQCAVPPGVGTVMGIAAGSWHNMALRTDGTLYGWGDNRYLQLHVPLGLDHVIKAVCGDSHTLALRDDGTVVTWGHSQWLQSEAPSGLGNVRDIAAGGDHSAILLNQP